MCVTCYVLHVSYVIYRYLKPYVLFLYNTLNNIIIAITIESPQLPNPRQRWWLHRAQGILLTAEAEDSKVSGAADLPALCVSCPGFQLPLYCPWHFAGAQLSFPTGHPGSKSFW